MDLIYLQVLNGIYKNIHNLFVNICKQLLPRFSYFLKPIILVITEEIRVSAGIMIYVILAISCV